jgi:hypothetical protein
MQQHPNDWAFALMKPTHSHFLAMSLRRGAAASPLPCTGEWFVPLVGAVAPLSAEPLACSA